MTKCKQCNEKFETEDELLEHLMYYKIEAAL